MREGKVAGTLGSLVEGCLCPVCRALHGARQRQDGRKEAQVREARICGRDARGKRKGCPGGVREEEGAGSPRVPAAGLVPEPQRRRKREAREQGRAGAGGRPRRERSRAHFKGKSKSKWHKPGGPRTRGT